MKGPGPMSDDGYIRVQLRSAKWARARLTVEYVPA
jgi:hypothetical protein